MNNKIIIREKDGADELVLENDSIISCNINRPCDPSLLELSIGTLEAVLRISGLVEGFAPADYPDGMESADGQTVYCRDADASVLNSVQYGFDVLTYTNDILIGTYYVKTITRTGPEEYTLMAQNWAGVLNDFVRRGALYRDPRTIITVVTDIISNTDMPVWLRSKIHDRISQDALLDDIVTRNNYIYRSAVKKQIQDMLFAYGAYMRENSDGSLVISPILGSVSSTISNDGLYDAGNVEYAEQPGTLTVREYTFTINDNYSEDSWELLFDNTEFGIATDVNDVSWDGEPMSNIRIDNGPGYYSGTYFHFSLAGAHKLYGRRYLATYRDVVETNPAGASGADITVDCVLVNQLNSSAVMRRLKAFYFSERKIIKQDFVYHDEIPGACYAFTDSFGDPESGILGNSTLTLSAVPKVSAEFHANWEPFISAPFSHSVRLTGSGSWTVPDGVDAIQVVLIGGGSGGSSGLRGENGESRKTGDFGQLAWGGEKGRSGIGGKIRIVTINNPDKVYNYSCGNGGAGGLACSSQTTRNEGKPGKDTLFGSYSSAYGESNDQGYADKITRQIYGGRFGKTKDRFYLYTDGASMGGYTVFNQAYSFNYEYWASQKYYYGTLTPAAANTTTTSVRIVEETDDYKFDIDVPIQYSGPGGSAVKVRGGQRSIGSRKSKSTWILGDGGAGAAPSIAGLYPLDQNTNMYGWGGGAGYGGGAGGASGFVPSWWYTYPEAPEIERFWKNFVNDHFATGKGGKGGNGGAGGKGAPGCIIIYY